MPSANDSRGEGGAPEIVSHSGEYTRLSHTEEESHGESLAEVVDEGHDEGEEAEAEG